MELAPDGGAVQGSTSDTVARGPGSTRLSLAVGYFGVMTWLMALLSTAMVAALVFPQLGWRATTGHKFVELATAVVLTAGFARTRMLLRARSRIGAFLAISMFAIDIVEDFVTGARGWSAIAFSALGLILVSSIWKYLDDE